MPSLSLLLSAATCLAPPQEPLRIGVIAADTADSGDVVFVRGARRAAEARNQQGGVDGAKVELVFAAATTPAEVAALAPHVLAVAAGGDTLAQGIADYAARELSQLAICLVPKMDVSPPIPVAVTGGLLGADQTLRKTLLAKLAEESVFQPTDTPVDAVSGALRMAEATAS